MALHEIFSVKSKDVSTFADMNYSEFDGLLLSILKPAHELFGQTSYLVRKNLRIQSWFRYQCLSILCFLHVFILHAILQSMSKLQVSVIIYNFTN